jgi:hypothetical protein
MSDRMRVEELIAHSDRMMRRDNTLFPFCSFLFVRLFVCFRLKII